MPLSEEELRLLEQMERALSEEDPKFASTLRGTSLRRSARRRAIAAGACFVAGVALLMTGVVTQLPVVGIVGFLVMLGAGTVALTSLRGQAAAAAAPADPRQAEHPSRFTVIDGGRKSRPRRTRRPSGSSGSFMERMEERWRRRREQNGGF
ncbi:DUF3040 domain-containing protein [Nocardioides deserti]|uniref:DUF3040 domain-containing protein n=2 Tax=Nocardioides deserti TaxID=1588644 RepID=A0ABR6U2Y5_9ACTN|nr:DUF3040 domain-containing protein [Nocardioides deserti]MBC2958772.1 DUF3040 domain-containing protein [Nocardioides deserti]